jgi:anaerobic ribonucleoside-triphosphate reductase activating protein
MMHYASIHEHDIANGPGIRLSLFVSGCRHACPGCFNQVAWDFNYGEVFSKPVYEKILSDLREPCYRGLTLLGGEPMEPENQRALLPFLRRFKQVFPRMDLWIYTGFTYEVLSTDPSETTQAILDLTDVLVDGRFMQEQKDITLLYRGSANQRIIDVKNSRQKQKVVLWDDRNVSISNQAH